jgi:hypothetical protein
MVDGDNDNDVDDDGNGNGNEYTGYLPDALAFISLVSGFFSKSL